MRAGRTQGRRVVGCQVEPGLSGSGQSPLPCYAITPIRYAVTPFAQRCRALKSHARPGAPVHL